MYDKDFVNVSATRTADEIGWNYYYVVSGNTLDRATCELPRVGICQSCCFFYRNGFLSNSVQVFTQACNNNGGKVINVDRMLKQYCMAQAVEQTIGNEAMTLNGVQNKTTGKWRYFDGTIMTYFYWHGDIVTPQPDYKSPTASPGLYEGYLATKKIYKYRWHDAPDKWMTSVLCEIL